MAKSGRPAAAAVKAGAVVVVVSNAFFFFKSTTLVLSGLDLVAVVVALAWGLAPRRVWVFFISNGGSKEGDELLTWD